MEYSGEHRGRLDITRRALLPVVGLDSLLSSLATGVTSMSAPERLHTAAETGALSTGDATTLQEAGRYRRPLDSVIGRAALA